MDPKVKDKLVYTHGALMIFVWMFAVPFAVGANMYTRKTGKTWGPKLHMLVMGLAAFLPFTISSILAYTAAGGLKPKPHSAFGSVITLATWVQVFIGISNHLLFRYRKRKNCLPDKRPWNNHVHIWFGRVLVMMAAVNIALGMKAKRAPLYAYILYLLWLTLLALSFIWLIWMKPVQMKLIDDMNDTRKQEIEIRDEDDYVKQ